MRTVKLTLFKIDELLPEARQKAINDRTFYNVEGQEWRSVVYDDAENVDIEIESFDLEGRNEGISISFMESAYDSAILIKNSHGEESKTYELANAFLAEYTKIQAEIDTETASESEIDRFDAYIDVLEDKFEEDMREAYLQILKDEYEYLTSEEAILESIRANEVEFTAEGEAY